MTFSQLTPGASIHVLEVTSTFKKSTLYSLGNIVSVSKPYEEPLQPNQFIPSQNRQRLVDIVISCDGEQKKLTVAEDKTITTDNTIGLTLATDKNLIINKVKQSYNDAKIKKENASKYDEEMKRCEDILKTLNTTPEVSTNEQTNSKEIQDLKTEVNELKNIIKTFANQKELNNLQETNNTEVG